MAAPSASPTRCRARSSSSTMLRWACTHASCAGTRLNRSPSRARGGGSATHEEEDEADRRDDRGSQRQPRHRGPHVTRDAGPVPEQQEARGRGHRGDGAQTDVLPPTAPRLPPGVEGEHRDEQCGTEHQLQDDAEVLRQGPCRAGRGPPRVPGRGSARPPWGAPPARPRAPAGRRRAAARPGPGRGGTSPTPPTPPVWDPAPPGSGTPPHPTGRASRAARSVPTPAGRRAARTDPSRQASGEPWAASAVVPGACHRRVETHVSKSRFSCTR